MECKKRQRAPNFTSEESMLLCSLVKKYKYIIENKKTDGATVADTQSAWKMLTDEYNANTTYVARTSENLVASYKNLKTKTKKKHSNDKMMISNVDTRILKENVVQSVAVYGQDWEMVSTDLNLPPEKCQTIFTTIAKEAKKSEAEYKKQINGTVGGPPPSPDDDPLLETVKSLIGPSLEGLYTVYDSDADFMKQQQEMLPSTKQTDPIDVWFDGVKEEAITPRPKQGKRLKIIKKKLDPALEVSEADPNSIDAATTSKKMAANPKKKNVIDSFIKLSEAKKELVEIQLQTAKEHLRHQKYIEEIEVEQLLNKTKFEKEKQEAEMKFLKEKWELELHLLKNKQAN